MLTKEALKAIVEQYAEFKKSQRGYDSNEFNLNTTKGRYYAYLYYCVVQFRQGNTSPLEEVLTFLTSDKKNKAYLATQLMDRPEQTPEKCWSVGEHEWLLRSLIVDVLKRSAGLVEGVESHKPSYCIFGEYNWLNVQHDIRTPTDAILFRTEDRVVRTGHKGAVKATPDTSRRGSRTAGSPGFHDQLLEAFDESTTIDGFLKRIDNIAKTAVFTGKSSLNADEEDTNYLSTGAATSDEDQVNTFRKEYLKEQMASCRTTLFGARKRTQCFDVEDDVASTTTEDSVSFSEESDTDSIDELVHYTGIMTI